MLNDFTTKLVYMGTKVINNSQVKSALKVKGPFGTLIASVAMAISGLNKMNKIYSRISDCEGIEFAEKLIEYLNITCDFNPEELEHIPKDQPFIIISNHPYGAIDGMMMLSIIGSVRPDIKILTNFILSYIPSLQNSFFPVNPFTDKPGLRSSVKGLKLAKAHLQSGAALGLFPAGEVSSNTNPEKVVKDIAWQPSIIKLIKGMGVLVVPVFFSGQNSALFHFLGKIHPILRTIRLPHELSNKKNKTISLRIGIPIHSSEIEEYDSIEELGKYLWNRTYSLEANIEKKEKNTQDPRTEYTSSLGSPVDPEKLEKEIATLAPDLLFDMGNYACYLADYNKIPNLMYEIGLRREITFRAVGEGTNNEIDTDKYDAYYKHLILWDKAKGAIVGAYRLGFGKEILDQYGLDGLYTHSLFNYKKTFQTQLERSIELGRSFVSLEYQKEPTALMLLIKGLFYTVIKHKKIKYLIGPVSISSWYPLFYRSLMIYYLQQKHAVPRYASMVSPKMPFVPNYNKVDVEALLESKIVSLEKFDRFIFRMSNNKYRLPTLLKKYLKINARIIGFNVDPDFNHCVDGLIMLALNEVPRTEIDALSKEFEDKKALYKRFDISGND